MHGMPGFPGALLGTIGLLLGFGCTVGGPEGDTPGPDRTSASENILPVPAQAPEIFEEYITGARTSEVVCGVYFRDAGTSMLPVTPGPGDPRAIGVTQFSRTNLREADVDEADRLKFDGEHLFIADSQVNIGYRTSWDTGRPIFTPTVTSIFPGPLTRVFRRDLPTPASDSVTLESAASESTVGSITGSGTVILEGPTPLPPPVHEIRVMAVDPDNPEASEVARISLPNASGGIHGLYHLAANDTGQAALLAALSTGNVYSGAPSWNQLAHTMLDIYDVDDPADPVPAANIELDGRMVASRRLGDRLILVTRFQAARPHGTGCPRQLRVGLPGTQTAGGDDAGQEGSDDPASFQLLPMLRIDAGDPEPLVDIDSCFVPASMLASDIRTSMVTTVTSIDLREPDDHISICLAGMSASVYAAPEALYLAQPASNIDPATGRHLMHQSGQHIFKIALDEAGPIYRGGAFVEGGFQTSNSSFSMGENDGVLGVVTTVLGTEHQLTLLAESEDVVDPEGEVAEPKLAIIAELPNDAEPDPIGKPGEQLHSVRFAGDRVYAVTFKSIDPLYIIDVSDPEDPFIAGEVEVPGFSDYLHPIGENLLLGIGKDSVDMGNFAWYQGIKLELFDVSDPSTLSSIDSVVIGMRGSQSAALTNHHAVSHLSLPSGLHRVTLPIEVRESGGVGDNLDHPWTETGLALFEIQAASNPLQSTLEPAGMMVRDTPGDGSLYDPLRGFIYDPRASTRGDRAVLAGDHVHYVHDQEVWSASWFAPEDAIGPQ